MSDAAEVKNKFLADLGVRIKLIRRAKKMSRRHIAEVSTVSQRFLSQFEAGEGNISVSRLHSLCEALGVTLESVVSEPPSGSRLAQVQSAVNRAGPAQLEMIATILNLDEQPNPTRNRIALIGLRGAGKTTLGEQLAKDLQYELVELDQRIEALAGIGLSEVFSLYGHAGYRRLERQALEQLTKSSSNVVITTGGSLVTNATTYHYLLGNYLTVWVSTSAEEHMSRVIAQGDQRPMEGEDSPLHSIRSILEERQPLYAQAPLSINTSSRTVAASGAQLLKAVLDYR